MTNNKISHNDERMFNSETAATPKKLHSEVTSTTHRDNHNDENGSIKSIEHSPPR